MKFNDTVRLSISWTIFVIIPLIILLCIFKMWGLIAIPILIMIGERGHRVLWKRKSNG